MPRRVPLFSYFRTFTPTNLLASSWTRRFLRFRVTLTQQSPQRRQMPQRWKANTLVFLWDNFGPYHMDRVEAVCRQLRCPVIGIELSPKSDTYDWASRPSEGFERRTIFADAKPRTLVRQVREILASLPNPRDSCFFLCHYEDPVVFMVAVILRLRGGRVIMMNNSKFDDKRRGVWKEFWKSLFVLPYHGALSSGLRSKAYWQFLGLKPDTVQGEYNTVSLSRIRRQAGVPPAPNGPDFPDRHFTSIARLVPKKNLSTLLSAYALYREIVHNPRPLHLCGSGPEEASLRREAAGLGLSDYVIFRGWLQDYQVSHTLGHTLALLLPSIEEQFGNVVIEAQALGLPVILSDNCGARDLLVRSAVNGFVVEPDNPRGLAYFMSLLCEDETLWRRMCDEASTAAPKGDVQRFVEGVETLAAGN